MRPTLSRWQSTDDHRRHIDTRIYRVSVYYLRVQRSLRYFEHNHFALVENSRIVYCWNGRCHQCRLVSHIRTKCYRMSNGHCPFKAFPDCRQQHIRWKSTKQILFDLDSFEMLIFGRLTEYFDWFDITII